MAGLDRSKVAKLLGDHPVRRDRDLRHPGTVVRHLWYSGAILILWSRTIDGAALVTNLALTSYLLIGTILEERKLVAEFGEEYLEYRRKVPMLIPRLGTGKNRRGRISDSGSVL